MRANAAVFALSLLWILGLESYALRTSPYPPGYLHPWGSEIMMQSLRIDDLKREPLRTLLCLDRQPPALNAIRAAAAVGAGASEGPPLAEAVDRRLMFLWALCFAALNVLVFAWLRRASDSLPLSIGGAVLWALHPSPLHFSVLLEGTLLSALAVTWLLYELHGAAAGWGRSRALAFSSAAAFYARSIFQWYFFPVLVGAAWLGGLPRPKARQLALWCAALALPLLIKQCVFTGTLATSTFEGDHKLGLVWHHPSPEELDAHRRATPPPVESPVWHPNHWVFKWCPPAPHVFTNDTNLHFFRKWVPAHTQEAAAGVWKSVRLNWSVFWRPSAISNEDHLSHFTPLREPWLFLFSETQLKILVGLSILLWSLRLLFADSLERRRRLRLGAALALVAGYVFVIIHLANRYEWTEGDRLKFVLEPAFFVFMLTEAWAWIRAAALRKIP